MQQLEYKTDSYRKSQELKKQRSSEVLALNEEKWKLKLDDKHQREQYYSERRESPLVI